MLKMSIIFLVLILIQISVHSTFYIYTFFYMAEDYVIILKIEFIKMIILYYIFAYDILLKRGYIY